MQGSNRYPGKCALCKKEVPRYTGLFDGRFNSCFHLECLGIEPEPPEPPQDMQCNTCLAVQSLQMDPGVEEILTQCWTCGEERTFTPAED